MARHLACKGQRPKVCSRWCQGLLWQDSSLWQPLSWSMVQAAPRLQTPDCINNNSCHSLGMPAAGGNPDSNTLISDSTTVICLDDYHSLDRSGRKKEGVTALDPKAQNFELMAEQVGKAPEMAVDAFPFCCFHKVMWRGYSASCAFAVL